MVDESIVMETVNGKNTVIRPQESEEFAKLAGATLRYIQKFGLTEALKALETMQTAARTLGEFQDM